MRVPVVPWVLAVAAVWAALPAAASAHPSSGIVVDKHPRCVINADSKTERGPPAKTVTLRLDGGLAFECLRIEPGRFMMGAPAAPFVDGVPARTVESTAENAALAFIFSILATTFS